MVRRALRAPQIQLESVTPMAKIPLKTLMAPATIYQHAAFYAEGFRPTASSRFGVVRERAGEGPWLLVHIRSGSRVGGLLPALPRKLTLSDVLAVAAAFEAQTHLDWGPFDRLPEVQEGDRKGVGFAMEDADAARTLAASLRELAAQTLQGKD